jgi:hypothetical protein
MRQSAASPVRPLQRQPPVILRPMMAPWPAVKRLVAMLVPAVDTNLRRWWWLRRAAIGCALRADYQIRKTNFFRETVSGSADWRVVKGSSRTARMK